MKRTLLGFAVLLAGCRNAPPAVKDERLDFAYQGSIPIGLKGTCSASEYPGLSWPSRGGTCYSADHVFAIPVDLDIHAAFAEGLALESECMLDIAKGSKPEQSENCRAENLPWPGPMEYYEKKFPVKGGKP